GRLAVAHQLTAFECQAAEWLSTAHRPGVLIWNSGSISGGGPPRSSRPRRLPSMHADPRRLGRQRERRHLRRVARRVLAEEALMPAKQLERLRLVPELDLPDQLGFSV